MTAINDVNVYWHGALIRNCVDYSVEEGWSIYEDYAIERIIDGFWIVHKTKITGDISTRPKQ